MKSAALCLLAISAPACNWVFGIDPTLLVDAGSGPGEAPLPAGRLTWMIAATDTLGNPIAAAEFRAITPPPSAKIGAITGALTDVALDATGSFETPRAFPGTPWRLVYQLPNDIPREVHWRPGVGRVPHMVVPLYGRADRAPIPGPNTVMSLTPLGSPPTTYNLPRVFTIGVWTESLPVPTTTGPTFNYNLNQSTQLSGPPGAPERVKGDKVVLSEFQSIGGNCRAGNGSAAFELDLIDGVSSTFRAETWRNTGGAVIVNGDSTGDRTRVALSAGAAIGSVRVVIQVGASPSSAMPMFTQRTSFLGLRGPLVIAMLECDVTFTSALPIFSMPAALSVFPRLAQLQLTADRTTAGAVLTSGVAAVSLMSTDTANLDLTLALPVAPFRLGSLDLSSTDGSLLPGGTDPLVFTFGNEAGMMVPEYYEVVLHRIEGGSAIPERAYTITSPTLTIERSVLAGAGTQYVFQVRSFLGAPGAADADFTRYSPMQSSAVTWTHSFITP